MDYNLEEYVRLEQTYKYPYEIRLPRQSPTLLPTAYLGDLFMSPEAMKDFGSMGCVSEWICPECKKKTVSSGPPRVEDDINYVWGPCICGYGGPCWNCGYESPLKKRIGNF